MRWDHCKACNEQLELEDLLYDPRQELCKMCFIASDLKEYCADILNIESKDDENTV